MKLPNADLALVEREKIIDYLLNADHPDNGGKAKFFTALGFSPDNWMIMATSLRALAQRLSATMIVESSHGIKYIIDGALSTPSGRKL